MPLTGEPQPGDMLEVRFVPSTAGFTVITERGSLDMLFSGTLLTVITVARDTYANVEIRALTVGTSAARIVRWEHGAVHEARTITLARA